MNLETLKKILNIFDRKTLYEEILSEFKSFKQLEHVQYNEYEISDGIIPVLTINKNLNVNQIKYVKLFIGAQHNEYNGLFGILEFFRYLYNGEIKIADVLRNNQILIFMPLMNPYGFLNPQKNNKSGYYLRNGENLNRFWRKAFVPEHKDGRENLDEHNPPEQVKVLKNLLHDFWKNEKTLIYILDFHETSLIKRFPIELQKNLSLSYKFDHWLKEGIIFNIIKLHNIDYSRKPLFFKPNPSADHTRINLTHKQIKIVSEKLGEYLSENLGVGKLPFYFCYNKKSKDYCKKLAKTVYDKLKNKLWETYFPAFDHYFINHGCFINMGDATSREKVISMELESQKQFFNIFDEIEKSKSEPDYFKKKLYLINLSIELVLETIKEMINLF